MKRLDSLYKSNYSYLFPITIGIFVTLFYCGPRCLDPTNIGWLIEGDSAQHYLGWAFYRSSPWTFPVGLNPSWGLENSSSIIYADALPFLAIPFKAMNAILPEPFQYYGLWILLSFTLSAAFAWRLFKEQGCDILINLCGTFLLALSPIIALRVGAHQSLAGQWLIIWALANNLSSQNNFRWIEWVVMLSASIAVHPYLTVMCAFLFVSDFVQREFVLTNITETLKRNLIPLAILGLTSIVTAWQVGLIGTTANPDNDGGFGFFRANLNTFFNPMGTSSFLLSRGSGAGDYEGFAYLGIGVLLLLVVVTFVLTVHPKAKFLREKVPTPLMVSLLLLAIWSVSPNIGFDNWTMQILHIDSQIVQIFRASGRFIWPLWYFIVIILVLQINNILSYQSSKSRAVYLFLVFICFLQCADFYGFSKSIKNTLMQTKSSSWWHYDSEAWKKISEKYTTLRVLKFSGLNYSQWREVSILASTYGLKTNVAYLARINKENLREQCLKDEALLNNFGNFAKNTIYIFPASSLVSLRREQPELMHRLRKLDDFLLYLPESHATTIGEPITNLTDFLFQLKANERINIGGSCDVGKILQDGWHQTESWGVWGSGTSSKLQFLVPDQVTYLEITGKPFIGGNLPTQRVLVTNADGEVIFDNYLAKETTITIPLAKVTTEVMGEKVASLLIKTPDALSPKKSGSGSDVRILGFGLRSLEVK